MSVCCECCFLSSRGLCDELITLPKNSYWLWCVVEWLSLCLSAMSWRHIPSTTWRSVVAWRPTRFTLGKRAPSFHWIWGSVGYTFGPDVLNKILLPGIEPRVFGLLSRDLGLKFMGWILL
jgi:hypothetical protein